MSVLTMVLPPRPRFKSSNINSVPPCWFAPDSSRDGSPQSIYINFVRYQRNVIVCLSVHVACLYRSSFSWLSFHKRLRCLADYISSWLCHTLVNDNECVFSKVVVPLECQKYVLHCSIFFYSRKMLTSCHWRELFVFVRKVTVTSVRTTFITCYIVCIGMVRLSNVKLFIL